MNSVWGMKMTKVPLRYPTAQEAHALRDPALLALDTVRDQLVRQAASALAQGIPVDICCDGRVLSRFKPLRNGGLPAVYPDE